MESLTPQQRVLFLGPEDPRYRGEFDILSGRGVSESEIKALCPKNSADCLRNVFNDMILVGGNWWDKTNRIPNGRSRPLTDFLFKPSPI
jgi:hypothetical protein